MWIASPPALRRAALYPLVAALLAGCSSADRVAEVRELHASGSFGESLAPLRDLVAERPDDPEIQYLYGRALVRTGQAGLALWSLRKAMDSPEWRARGGLELAAAALQTGNEELAIEAATSVLEAEPDNLEALLMRAQARVSSPSGYEQGLADAERVLERDPGNAAALVPRAVALLGLERAEEAESALAELENGFREAELGPDNAPSYCVTRALFAQAKGDLEAAEARYRDCLEEFPASYPVVQGAIEYYDEQGKPDRVIEILRKALAEAPPGNLYVRILAERMRAAGDVEEAERLLREGAEVDDPAAASVAWVDLGDHYLALEDYAQAASALGHAVELGGKSDPQLLFDYADALVMAGRYDEALEIARGMQVPAHRELVAGRAALKRGNPAEALERFSAALLLWPDNAVARYYAAVAAEGVGDFDRAISEYRYSVRADPAATDARLRLARLHEAEGADELAFAVARHDTSRRPGGIELDLVGLRTAARLGRQAELRGVLVGLAAPAARARAVAALAAGTRDRLGPRAAARLVQTAERLDLRDPEVADALRALVVYLGEAGEPAQARAAVEAALARHPDAAVFHEIHGLALAANHASADAVRGAWTRAVELDPKRAEALAGLARLAAEAGDATAALDFYARAAAAEPEDPSPLRASAGLLASLGRREEAEGRLAEALERDPYDGRAAARLAELLLEREAEVDRALALARRAGRFGGGADSYELLARLHEQRGEAKLASEARAEAQVRREPARESR